MIGQLIKSDSTKYITNLNYNKINEQTFKINFNKGSKYYIKIQFDVSETPQDIQVYLSTDSSVLQENKIDNFYFPEKTPMTKEIIIAPNKDYNFIYISFSQEATTILNLQIYKIENILPVAEVNKIGVWGNPSQILCINGEKIQIGRAGIYEIYNQDILINFIGIIPQEANFIIDYEY